MLDELKRLIKNPYFWLYIGAAASFFVVWYCTTSLTARIICIFIVALCQGFLNVKVLTNTDITNRFFKWTYFIVLLLFAVAYLSASVQEIEIAATTFIITPYILTGGLLVLVISGLWKSKNTWTIIISYVFLAVLVITLFAYSFAILSTCKGNEVEWVSGHVSITDPWALMYFSTEVFYSNSFGDIVTLGLSRLLASIELVTSAIIHIIVLGIVISNLKDRALCNNVTTLRSTQC